MFKISQKLFFIFICSFLILDQPVIGKCFLSLCNQIKENNKIEDKFLSTLHASNDSYINTLSIITKKDINQILKEEKTSLKILFDNLMLSDNNKSLNVDNKFSFDLESDIQYVQNDIFYAEGDVYILLPYGVFQADKISYDKENRIFKAYKNLKFEKGRQYLSADYLEYNLKNNKGKIKNVYGVINFQNIRKDLGLDIVEGPDSKYEANSTNLIDLPTEIELLNSTNLRIKNRASLDAFAIDFATITQWRFKSEIILVEDGKWNSELIYFTNDPFNKAQFKVKSKDFMAEEIDGKTKFTSRSTFLNFDDKIILPVGRKTITDKEAEASWGFGYEKKEKDGLYIMRNSKKLNIGKNFILGIKPYFLLQRSILGKSNYFRDKNSKVLSENIETDIDFLDYFAFNANLKGKLFNFYTTANIDVKTLNPSRYYDAFTFDLNLSKNIYNFSNQEKENIKVSQLSNTNKISKNFNIDLGSYVQFDKNDLYLGYGFKVLNKYLSSNINRKSDYTFILDYGIFKGKSLSNENQILELSRFGSNISLINEYKLIDFNNDQIFNRDNKYGPALIDNGLYLFKNISFGYYEYSDGQSQNIVSFKIGPNYKYGNLKRKLFDYTDISILPEFVLKDKSSPFKFDNFNNDSRIKLSIDQQLYGPLFFRFIGDYNLNSESSSYKTFENKSYTLKISRRAYAIDLRYTQEKEEIFLGFDIFNFSYKNNSPIF